MRKLEWWRPGPGRTQVADDRWVEGAMTFIALAVELPGPLEQAGVAFFIALDRQLAEQLAGLAVDRRRGVGLLVWVHTPITIMCTVPSLDIA